MIDISIVVPVFNEEDQIRAVYMDIKSSFYNREESYEIIFVNDGSKDGTGKLLNEVAQSDPRIQVVTLDKNYGKSASLQAGIKSSTGDLIVFMDASLQTTAKDIFRLKPFIRRKDFVNGRWRDCDDNVWNKFSLNTGNRIRGWITGGNKTDSICPLQLFKREVAESFYYFNGMHRFLPVMAKMNGFSTIDVTVRRNHGKRNKQSNGFMRNICSGISDAFLVALLKTRVTHYKIK